MDGFWGDMTTSGNVTAVIAPQSSVWKDFGHTFGYAPTDDGEFERWMDEHKPDWIVFTTNIELWRAIWEAARAHYSN